MVRLSIFRTGTLEATTTETMILSPIEQHSGLPSKMCHTMTCLHTERYERAWWHWHRGVCLLHCGSDNVTRQLPFSGKFERPHGVDYAVR
jgi:hypothetical protein